MAHFAKIENNIVTDVIVADYSFVSGLDGEWVQTSYNTFGNQHLLGGTPLRGNYAGLGYIYDRANDVFYPPKPYGSWVLDTNTWLWEPPIPRPSDEAPYSEPPVIYDWDETSKTWQPV